MIKSDGHPIKKVVSHPQNTRKKSIVFCIEDLSGGGAEKILTETVRKMDMQKYDITVLAIFGGGIYENDVKSLCKYRCVVPMTKSLWVNKIFKRLLILTLFRLISAKYLYRLCIRRRYDIEAAFLEGLSTKIVSGSASVTSQKYAWVHIDMIANPYSQRAYHSLYAEKTAYQKFDKILCVSSAVRESFIKKYGIDVSLTTVQLNVLDEAVVIKKSQENSTLHLPARSLVAVGRLSPEKEFSRLISVVAKLKDEGLNFSITILGEGYQRPDLENKIRQLGLQDTVTLAGFVSNPYPAIAQSYALVSSSRAEGFSTVVSEAIILGIPVVTTETAGMKDILGDSEYGLITPNNEDGLYEGLKRILSDDGYYNHLKKKADERKEFFKVDNRLRELDTLFTLNKNEWDS